VTQHDIREGAADIDRKRIRHCHPSSLYGEARCGWFQKLRPAVPGQPLWRKIQHQFQ
jgi:hypothetical protein